MWRKRLEGFTRDIQEELDRVSDHFGLLHDRERQHEVIGYRSHGSRKRVLVQGRVVACRRYRKGELTDSYWTNLLNTYRRVDSDPLPAARVVVNVGDVERSLTTDNEGFFREWIDLGKPLDATNAWHEAQLRLESEQQRKVESKALLRIPVGNPAFGVISDLDDTVIQSRVTSLLQAMRTIMLGNALTRLPFPGVAAFYRALEKGDDGSRANPIYYVSGSPWNVYDVVSDFMDIQKIPVGSIHLRDWDINLTALTSRHLANHKEPIIREILDLHPTLPFILIGDDSQQDPEIYRAILADYPGRILAIYIRNVNTNPERTASIQVLADEIKKAGSALVLADDTLAAARHAVEHGWIARESLASVQEDKHADEGKTGAKARVSGDDSPPPAPTVVVE